MGRNTVINVLLIIVGIVLAIALFGAGVLWKSRTATKTTGLAAKCGQSGSISVDRVAARLERLKRSPEDGTAEKNS